MSHTQLRNDSIAPGATESPPVTLARTDIHAVLSNERRAAVLELLEAESPRRLGTLAEEIAAAETGERPPPRNKRQSAYTTLHQTHLPKLDELDIVDYDAREKVVYPDVMAERLFVERGRDSPSASEPASAGPELWFGVAGIGLLASVASGLGAPGLELLAPAFYAIATLVVLLVAFAFQLGRHGNALVDRLWT